MFRSIAVLLLIALCVGACSNSTTAPQVEAEKVTASQMVKQYERLVRSYTTSRETFDVYRPWALLDMIAQAPPMMNPSTCTGGKALEDPRGMFSGIEVTVYTTTCGDLYFLLQTPAREYIIGPGGWSAHHAR